MGDQLRLLAQFGGLKTQLNQGVDVRVVHDSYRKIIQANPNLNDLTGVPLPELNADGIARLLDTAIERIQQNIDTYQTQTPTLVMLQGVQRHLSQPRTPPQAPARVAVGTPLSMRPFHPKALAAADQFSRMIHAIRSHVTAGKIKIGCLKEDIEQEPYFIGKEQFLRPLNDLLAGIDELSKALLSFAETSKNKVKHSDWHIICAAALQGCDFEGVIVGLTASYEAFFSAKDAYQGASVETHEKAAAMKWLHEVSKYVRKIKGIVHDVPSPLESFQSVDVKEFIRDYLADIPRGFGVDLEVSGLCEGLVAGPEIEVSEILLIFLLNACEEMRDGPNKKLTLAMRTVFGPDDMPQSPSLRAGNPVQRQYLALTIQDCGKGIASRILQGITQGHQDPDRLSTKNSTGLGLRTAIQLVERRREAFFLRTGSGGTTVEIWFCEVLEDNPTPVFGVPRVGSTIAG